MRSDKVMSDTIDRRLFQLQGKTRHGKNRVNEHGNIWEALENSNDPFGQRTLVRSVETGDLRWIETVCEDKNFIVKLFN